MLDSPVVRAAGHVGGKLFDAAKLFSPWGKAAAAVGTLATATWALRPAQESGGTHASLAHPQPGITIETLPVDDTANRPQTHRGKPMHSPVHTDTQDAGKRITPGLDRYATPPGKVETREHEPLRGFAPYQENSWANNLLLSEQHGSEMPAQRPSMLEYPGSPRPRLDLAPRFKVQVGRHVVTFSYDHPVNTGLLSAEHSTFCEGYVNLQGILEPTIRIEQGSGHPNSLDLFSGGLQALHARGVPLYAVQTKWTAYGLFSTEGGRVRRHLDKAGIAPDNASQAELIHAARYTVAGKTFKHYGLEPLSVAVIGNGNRFATYFGNHANELRYGALTASASSAPWSIDFAHAHALPQSAIQHSVERIDIDGTSFPLHSTVDYRHVDSGLEPLPTHYYSLELDDVPDLSMSGTVHVDIHDDKRLTWYRMGGDASVQAEEKIIRAFLELAKSKGVDPQNILIAWVAGQPEYARYQSARHKGLSPMEIIDTSVSVAAFETLGYRYEYSDVVGLGVFLNLKKIANAR